MRSIYFLIVLVIIALSMPYDTIGQETKFEGLSVEDGLSQGHIYDMLQSSDGYLWIATKDGLNRYDGYDYTIFKNIDTDPYSIENNAVRYLFEDSRGLLWIAAKGELGINIYDPSTERFYSLRTSELYGDIEIESLWPFSAIGEDNEGEIWIATFGGKIVKLSIPHNFIESIEPNKDSSPPRIREYISWEYQLPTIDVEDADVMKQDFVNHFQLTSDGLLTFGTLSKIVKVSDRNNLTTIDSLPFSIKDYDGFTTACEDAQGNLWYANEGRTSLVKVEEDKVREFVIGDDESVGLSRVNRDEFGNFYISGSKGVYSISSESIIAETLVLTLIDNERFDGQRPSLVDKSNVLWVDHPQKGVSKFTPLQEKFGLFLKGGSIYRIFPNHDGSEIYVSKKSPCILRGNDVDLLKDLNVSSYHNVYYEPIKGVLWSIQRNYNSEVGTFLVKEYLKSGSVQSKRVEIEEHHVHPFIRDRKGYLWIGLNQGGIARINEDDLSLTKFENSNYNDGAHQIFQTIHLYEDVHDHLYASTQNGLVRIQTDAEGNVTNFKNYKNDETLSTSLSSSDLLAVLDDPADPEKYLWVGSKGRGLNKMNKETGVCLRIGLEDGLPDDVIYGILADDEGLLWMSTNKGIARLNPDTQEIKVFSKSDGLQDMEFNTGSFANLNNGMLAFGGVQGLNIFDPRKIKFNTHEPPMVITSLKVNDEQHDYNLQLNSPNSDTLTTSLNRTYNATYNPLELSYDQNLITLSYAALDFTNPNKNQYEYILEGHDDQWNKVGDIRFALYSNLQPGRYDFKVKGSNNDGLWASQPASMKIIIHPPWYKTKLAYGIYLLALSGAIVGLYWFQLKRAKLHNLLIFEKKEGERLKELDTIKSTFFSNVTHEFRTPLTLILEPVRQLLKENFDERSRQNLRLVKGNAHRLMDLVNQLLDMAKFEAGKMTIDLQHAQIGEIVQPIMNRFTPLLQKKRINLLLDIEKDNGIIEVDVGKLKKIIYNLLSNAIKNTEQGEIHFSILSQPDSTSLQEEDIIRHLHILVKDTGVGIPEVALPYIFDRFYQVDGSSSRKVEGTGIGLALTKEYVALLGGEIRVTSTFGVGTSFEVIIPLTATIGQANTEGNLIPFFEDSKYNNNLPHAIKEANAEPVLITPNVILEGQNEDQAVVLLVEDNDELRNFIKQSLQNNYKVLEAANGSEGLKIAVESIPDLIVSDVMMPQMDGVEMSYKIRADQLTSHIPIILLTAKSAIASKLEGLESGVDAYLTKPFHLDELQVRIHKLIEIRSLLHKKYSAGIEIQRLKEESTFSELDQQFLQNLSDIIEREYINVDFAVEVLAAKIFMSRSQLYRKTKALLGVAPNEVIRNYRLDQAKRILSTTNTSIYEVSQSVGFNNEKYFSTRFKARFKIPPSKLLENEQV